MAKAPSSTDPIMAPAIRLRGMVHAAPRPAEHDVDGINTMMHGNAIWHAVGTGKASKEEASRALLDPTAMGFVTRSGKYLTRREAAAHVLATNQFRIKNPKDSQLQQLKQRLQRQIDTGHPETSLDSFDIDFMAKGGYTFETVTNERSALHHDLKIRMTEQGSGKAVLAKLNRHHNHPEGQWEMESVMRPVGQQAPRPLTGLGGWTDPGNANTIGVAGIRALARHLKDTYGVTKLTGARISGARRNAPVVKQYVNVNLTKAQAQFTELEHIKDPEFTGLTVRVMHPDGKQGADLHLMRQHDHPEGHWHIMNVDPVDKTLSIRGHVHSRAFANRLGPGIIRQTVRHLKNTYGITSVRGFRVSGSRFAGQPDDHAAIEKRDSQTVSVKLGKAFQNLVDRLEKARVTPVFRATSTPPDASGRMTFRDNPQLGVTYFANTPEGASGAALTNAHDTRADKWPRHVAATAVTRQHRIYGHNMPTLVPESRVQARLAHFDRIAASAPHEGIGNVIRHLATREANRSHKVVTDAQGNKYRKYKEAHLPLFFAELDGHKAHFSDNGPVPYDRAEWRAMKESHPAHTKMRSVFQMALHHMGYHGTAVTDEGGSWNEYVRPAGDRGPRNQGSIALFPKVAAGLYATARAQKNDDKPDIQEKINTRRPGGFIRKPSFVSRVMSTLFGKA